MSKLEPRPKRYQSTWPVKQMDRIAGRTLQISSLLSVLINLVLIVTVPIVFVRFSRFVDNVFFVISNETDQAAVSLRQLNGVLLDTVNVVEATRSSLIIVEGSIEDIDPLLSPIERLISDTAPTIIENTNNALASAKDGAKAADLVLRNLAKFSLITGVTYSPEQSLDTGIDQILQSLQPLPGAFRDAGSKLLDTTNNLKKLGLSLSEIGEQMDSFIAEIADNENFILDLANDLDNASESSNKMRSKSKYLMAGAAVLFETLIISNLVSKLVLFYYGKELISSSDNNQEK